MNWAKPVKSKRWKFPTLIALVRRMTPKKREIPTVVPTPNFPWWLIRVFWTLLKSKMKATANRAAPRARMIHA